MADTPALRLPDGLTPGQFLETCWQKRPMLLPDAIPGFRPPLTIDEIAGLACEDEVESRLVFTDRDGSRTRYRVESGPFDPARLTALPDRDWTLLVHDVDYHLPELRPLLFAPVFLPAWRMGDLMVSIAAPGGSVGPHRDSYDVFLLQGEGRRRWQIGDGRPGQDDSGLRLLEDFRATDSWDCGAGDAVYVPPGVGHHGVASSLATTWSLGLQAPLLADLAACLDLDGRHAADERYADPDLGLDEVRGGLIAPAAIRRCRRALGVDEDTSDEDIAEALGRLATMPKPAHRPLPPTADEAARLVTAARRGRAIRPAGPAARYESADGGLLFLAGESFPIDAASLPLAIGLSEPAASAGVVITDRLSGAGEGLLRRLCRHGLVEAAET